MRVDVPENTSYREHDPRTTDRDSRSYDDRIYSGNRFNRGGFSYFDRLRRPGAFRMREHYGDDTSTGHSRFHDFVLEKFGLIVGVGVVALIAWLAAKILKLAVPTKWTFLYGLLNVIDTVGWWVMIICAAVLIIGWIVGHAHKFMNWARSRY